MIRVLRDPGDITTPAGRAHERHRRALMATLMSLVAKLVSIGTMLITVPLTLGYLGAERYGMWMIMSSLVAMLSFADLGIGNGVLNAVSAAHGRDDLAAMRRSISSATVVLCLIAVTILAVFTFAYSHVVWHELFNVRGALARREAGPAIAVFVLCFAIAIPFSIVQRVQIGLQMGFLANLWQCAASVVALVAVVIAVELKAGLPVLVAAFMGAPLIAAAGNSLFFFGRRYRHLAPRLTVFDPATAREVMQIGVLFLLLQVAAAATYSAHNVLIAQILGPASVAAFAVPERLFSIITMLVTMTLAPLWPAYREAIQRGDTDWVRHTLRRSVVLSVAGAAAMAAPLVFLSPWVIHWWVAGAVAPPMLLLAGLGVWRIIEAVGLSLSMYLNGAHIVKAQVFTASMTAGCAILLEIALLKSIGVAGSVWAMIVAYGIFTIVPYAMMVPRSLRRLN